MIGYALLAVDTAPGDITLTATADGLESGSYTVATSPYSGRYMPDGRHPEWKDISTLEPQGALNIALNKPTTASSFQEGNIPGNAVDDDSDSKWVASGNIPAWWQVDLSQPSDISEFQIVWESDQANYQYAVLTSDDATNWTKVVDKESNTTKGGTVNHKVSTKARYVRVNVLSGGGWWPSIREFRVVPPGGTGGGQPADPGPKIPRGQISEVSASSHASGFEPARAFDDDITFGTGWVAASATLPQTLTVQLSAAHNLAACSHPLGQRQQLVHVQPASLRGREFMDNRDSRADPRWPIHAAGDLHRRRRTLRPHQHHRRRRRRRAVGRGHRGGDPLRLAELTNETESGTCTSRLVDLDGSGVPVVSGVGPRGLAGCVDDFPVPAASIPP